MTPMVLPLAFSASRASSAVSSVSLSRVPNLHPGRRVDTGLMAHQIRQRQRQRQAHQEALTAGKRASITYRIGLPGIDDFQLQRLADFAFEQIAPVQAVPADWPAIPDYRALTPGRTCRNLSLLSGQSAHCEMPPVIAAQRCTFNVNVIACKRWRLSASSFAFDGTFPTAGDISVAGAPAIPALHGIFQYRYRPQRGGKLCVVCWALFSAGDRCNACCSSLSRRWRAVPGVRSSSLNSASRKSC
jgi:hypothetical protein